MCRTVEPKITLPWPETTWVDCREITLFGSRDRDEKVDGFLGRTADGRVAVGFALGLFLWERATTEDLAAAREDHAATELKPVMSTILLAEKKEALQEFVARRQQKRLLDLFGKLEWESHYDYKVERARD